MYEFACANFTFFTLLLKDLIRNYFQFHFIFYNSRQQPSDRTFYLVNYPIFIEFGRALLETATPKEIRTSFQVYFKHRAKKLAV